MLPKAHVKDAIVTRITSDTDPNDADFPQIRACVRGRSYRKTFFHPDRLKYPMKRVGERGEGTFERISWEEATDIIARETARIREAYGPASRLVMYGTGAPSAKERPLVFGIFERKVLALWEEKQQVMEK